MTAQSEAKQTTDHNEIRRWAEKHKRKPATVKNTEHGKERAGILRIAFRDEENLEEISCDDFFEKFDESDLAFLYQDKTKDGHESRFFKSVKRPH